MIRAALLASSILAPLTAWAAGCNNATLDAANGNLLPSGYLSTSGSQIIGADGKAVRITSIGWYDGWNNIPADVAAMKDKGINTIRISWVNASMQSDLKRIDRVVAAAKANGVKVIIDNHTNEVGHSQQDNWGAQQKNGLWYDVGGASDSTDGGGNAGTVTQAKFVSDWTAVAQHYAGNSTVIGFDMRNEPLGWGKATWGTGDPNTDLQMMYTQVGNAIQQVNPNALLIAEGLIDYSQSKNGVATPWGLSKAGSNPVTLNTPNKVVYSVHDYPVDVSGWATDSGAAKVASMNDDWGYLVKDNIAPVWIGEMGSGLQTAGQQAWAQTLLDYMNGKDASQGGPSVDANHQGVSGDWWAWGSHPGDNPPGILNPDGSFNDAQLAAVLQMAGTGCGIPLASAPPVLSALLTAVGNPATAPTDAIQAQIDAAANQAVPSIDDVARQASEGLPASVQSALAGSVPDPKPVPLSVAMPASDLHEPVPPSDMTAVDVPGDKGAFVVPGNGQGRITGSGNILMGANGEQSLVISGPGNSVVLGPYNDTIVVTSQGNTINSGGGEDTINLAYSEATIAAQTVQLPTATVPVVPVLTGLGVGGLATTGNVIMLPAPGTGVLRITGNMAPLDRLDLTQALAGTTWNHLQSSMGTYVSVGASKTGPGWTVSVSDTVILTMPTAPSGDLSTILIAR